MHLRFHSAFGKLPATLQSALRPYIAAPDFPAMLTPEQTAAIPSTAGWMMMLWHVPYCLWKQLTR